MRSSWTTAIADMLKKEAEESPVKLVPSNIPLIDFKALIIYNFFINPDNRRNYNVCKTDLEILVQ